MLLLRDLLLEIVLVGEVVKLLDTSVLAFALHHVCVSYPRMIDDMRTHDLSGIVIRRAQPSYPPRVMRQVVKLEGLEIDALLLLLSAAGLLPVRWFCVRRPLFR